MKRVGRSRCIQLQLFGCATIAALCWHEQRQASDGKHFAAVQFWACAGIGISLLTILCAAFVAGQELNTLRRNLK